MPKNSRRKAGGRPYQLGQSGNPNGRPKKSPEQRAVAIDVRDYARGFTRECVDKLVRLMRGEAIVGTDEQGQPKIGPVSAKAQKEAAVELLDRGWGRPAQAMEVVSEQVVQHVSANDIEARIESRIALIRERLREQGVLPQ